MPVDVNVYHNHECCLLVCASFWPDVRARQVASVEVRVSTLTWHPPMQLSTPFAFWVQRRLTKSSTGFTFALYYRLFTFRCCVDHIAIVAHSVCPLPHQREAPGLPVLCEAARWLLCDACGRGGGRQVSSVTVLSTYPEASSQRPYIFLFSLLWCHYTEAFFRSDLLLLPAD